MASKTITTTNGHAPIPPREAVTAVAAHMLGDGWNHVADLPYATLVNQSPIFVATCYDAAVAALTPRGERKAVTA